MAGTVLTQRLATVNDTSNHVAPVPQHDSYLPPHLSSYSRYHEPMHAHAPAYTRCHLQKLLNSTTYGENYPSRLRHAEMYTEQSTGALSTILIDTLLEPIHDILVSQGLFTTGFTEGRDARKMKYRRMRVSYAPKLGRKRHTVPP